MPTFFRKSKALNPWILGLEYQKFGKNGTKGGKKGQKNPMFTHFMVLRPLKRSKISRNPGKKKVAKSRFFGVRSNFWTQIRATMPQILDPRIGQILIKMPKITSKELLLAYFAPCYHRNAPWSSISSISLWAIFFGQYAFLGILALSKPDQAVKNKSASNQKW